MGFYVADLFGGEESMMTLKEAREIAKVWRLKVMSLVGGNPTDRAVVILDDRITELEACLKWYADKSRYSGCWCPSIWDDSGKKARRVLKGNNP